MTHITAKLNFIRMAPRKLRLVADLVKGREVKDAELELKFLTKRGAAPMLKLLKSAISNARNNSKIPENKTLYIKDLRVDEGIAYKRFTPGARGRAYPIKKRTSKICLILDTKK